jgi:hypothetical protein
MTREAIFIDQRLPLPARDGSWRSGAGEWRAKRYHDRKHRQNLWRKAAKILAAHHNREERHYASLVG